MDRGKEMVLERKIREEGKKRGEMRVDNEGKMLKDDGRRKYYEMKIAEA